MSISNVKWIRTDNPDWKFEDNPIGRIKKEIWDADEAQLDKWLKEDFEIPSPSEIGKANCYVQTTPRYILNERRKKNDIVLIPVGCSECHGDALPTGQDVFQVSQVLEGVRRYTAKKGYEVNLAWPIMYGGHPAHHLGMPGTIVIPHEALMEQIIAMMLGLWNDGFRKIILVNNHGHQWTLASAVQEFCKRYSLPGVFRVIDWPHMTGDFWRPWSGKDDELHETFTHAGESETSLGLLLTPDMVSMEHAVDGHPEKLLQDDWFDNSIDDFMRPNQWYEGEGHNAHELSATPEGVVGFQKSLSDARKVKRPVVCFAKLITLLVEEILEDYPAGTVPPVEKTTLRTEEEMAPYLKEPMSEGWKSVYGLPRIGCF